MLLCTLYQVSMPLLNEDNSCCVMGVALNEMDIRNKGVYLCLSSTSERYEMKGATLGW